jgi:hypothetical protein
MTCCRVRVRAWVRVRIRTRVRARDREGGDLARGVGEDVVAHLDGALLLDDGLERRTAAHRVVHERERLAFLNGEARLVRARVKVRVRVG